MEDIKKRPWRVAKRLGLFIATILILFFIFKFLIYFLPFFIAGIIAFAIEPIIKLCMVKLNMSRRLSSIIIITLTIILIVAVVIWSGIFTVSEIVKLSKDIGPLISDISVTFENEVEEIIITCTCWCNDTWSCSLRKQQ